MMRIRPGIPVHRFRSARVCTFLGLALLASSGSAQAQPPAIPPPPAQHPWNKAAALYAEGTSLFIQWRFAEAEQKFQDALTYQEHPIIYLYLSRALEKQGRLVEAHEALQPALRVGVEPLPPEDAVVAAELRKNLESRLAQIEAHCDVPGVEISLDGDFWFVAPGWQRRMVSAGQHVIIARKAGYFPLAEQVSMIPGKQTRVVLRMTADVVRIERRWQHWQPWAVAGTGIAVSLAGNWIRQQAGHDYASVENALDPCRQTTTCKMIPTRRLASGKWKELAGTSALIVGGTVLVAGLTGVLFNRPRTLRSKPAGGVKSIDIAPMISGDTGSISAQIRF